MFLLGLLWVHIIRTPLSFLGSIPVVQRLYISVNVKDTNVFITVLATFGAVAVIRLGMV